MADQVSYAWATELCQVSTSTCPADVLEELMAAPECSAFGPVHHYLVGAALLACVHNATGAGDLSAQLSDLEQRSAAVPGGACARWGVCGAAASCGMALAAVLENAPLKADGWSENQLMVAAILQKIARAGAPRCCKRDARLAVREATVWFNKILGIDLTSPSAEPVCAVSGKNSVCLHDACPYYR